MYDVEYGEPVTYGRAYHYQSGKVSLLFIGHVDRLTSARRALMVLRVYRAHSAILGADVDPAALFARLPMTRLDDVTVRPMKITGGPHAREGFDYRSPTGSGELPAHLVIVNVS